MGTARNCPTYYWAEQNVGNPFLTWITDVLSKKTTYLVHSVSYTTPELYRGSGADPALNSRTNTGLFLYSLHPLHFLLLPMSVVLVILLISVSVLHYTHLLFLLSL
jgi:hypothetical protein